MEEKKVSVRGGMFETEVLEGGSGQPLLFLHGVGGLKQDDAFLAGLAGDFHVIAPRHPGFGNSQGDDNLTDLQDLLHYYLDFMDEQGLKDLPLVGHSLGGMFAAELAALQPDRFTKVVLISPFGLWNPEHPVLDFAVASPQEQAKALFYDTTSEVAEANAVAPKDEGDLPALLERVKSQRVVAKYLWPIPNRGFAKRAHRVRPPVQLIWGAEDAYNPPAYAKEFQQKLPSAQAEIIPEAAHMVHLEQPEAVLATVKRFLAS